MPTRMSPAAVDAHTSASDSEGSGGYRPRRQPDRSLHSSPTPPPKRRAGAAAEQVRMQAHTAGGPGGGPSLASHRSPSHGRSGTSKRARPAPAHAHCHPLQAPRARTLPSRAAARGVSVATAALMADPALEGAEAFARPKLVRSPQVTLHARSYNCTCRALGQCWVATTQSLCPFHRAIPYNPLHTSAGGWRVARPGKTTAHWWYPGGHLSCPQVCTPAHTCQLRLLGSRGREVAFASLACPPGS